MQFSAHLLIVFLLATSVLPTSAHSRTHSKLCSKILSPRSVYFDDRTGIAAVGTEALAQLKKWGRFRIVQDRRQAELIILLSADPYKGGYIIVSGGQTGTIDKDGNIEMDPVPNFNKLAPVRYAYLTVIDPKTGEQLWSHSRHWGGLFTGRNSAGKRLAKKLEKEAKR